MIDLYIPLKHLHMTLAMLSISGFVLRFFWVLSGSSAIHHRLSKVLPHVIDTLLLLCGVTLAVMLRLNPLEVQWLGMKLILLLLYIVLGTFALKRAPSQIGKIGCFVAAVLVFSQMLAVAFRHSAWGWLELIHF